MKKFFFIATTVWLLAYWHRHAATFKETGLGDVLGPNVVVITFSSDEELIEKLRRVKAGQKIDLRPTVPAPVSTRFRCVQTSAKAAYAERMKNEQEEERQTIIAELARIHG